MPETTPPIAVSSEKDIRVVEFTNSRWLKPIERFREDLYLYSPTGGPYTPDSIRARLKRRSYPH